MGECMHDGYIAADFILSQCDFYRYVFPVAQTTYDTVIFDLSSLLTMTKKSLNSNLTKAKTAKKDEFYTQLTDIEYELRRYKEHLKGKVVYCNCDDPFESNFFKYFAINFNFLGLKKLIATSYIESPIAGGQLPLLEIEGLKPEGKEPFKIEINEVKDFNSDGAINMADVEWLLRNDANIATPLEGNGDFRGAECTEFLKQADIVVTNPPFSLFREYVAQLIEYDKKFVIIGHQNAITYKETFKLKKKISCGLAMDSKEGLRILLINIMKTMRPRVTIRMA